MFIYLTDDCEIFDNYLKIQGLYLTKLRSNDNIIACLGMTSGITILSSFVTHFNILLFTIFVFAEYYSFSGHFINFTFY